MVKEGKRFLYAADQDYGEKVSTMIPFLKLLQQQLGFQPVFEKER